MIDFAEFNPSCLSQMHCWLNKGETLKWYARKPQTEEEVAAKYLERLQTPGVHCFIIEINSVPSGYLQIYCLNSFPDYYALLNGKPGDYGLDLFIGEAKHMGGGMGSKIVAKALSELVFSRKGAKRCLLGPHPDNKRAIRCYEKCGFRFQEIVTTPEESKEQVMVVEKSAIPALDLLFD